MKMKIGAEEREEKPQLCGAVRFLFESNQKVPIFENSFENGRTQKEFY